MKRWYVFPFSLYLDPKQDVTDKGQTVFSREAIDG